MAQYVPLSRADWSLQFDAAKTPSSGLGLGDGPDGTWRNAGDAVMLNAGDVYITKHSNLSGYHIVFHLVCNKEVLRAASLMFFFGGGACVWVFGQYYFIPC